MSTPREYKASKRRLALLASVVDKPRTRSDIRRLVYGELGDSAAEKAFQRDREALAVLGYEIRDRGEACVLDLDLLPLEIDRLELSILRLVASHFSSSGDDHRVVRSTITKLLAGASPRRENVRVKTAIPGLGHLLDVAAAMASRAPIVIEYTATSRHEARYYRLEPAHLWSSLGGYYVSGMRVAVGESAQTMEEAEPRYSTYKVDRISSLKIEEPTGFEPAAWQEPLAPMTRTSLEVDIAPGAGQHVIARGQGRDLGSGWTRVLLPEAGIDQVIDTLNQLGCSARTDNEEYLSRLRHLASLGES